LAFRRLKGSRLDYCVDQILLAVAALMGHSGHECLSTVKAFRLVGTSYSFTLKVEKEGIQISFQDFQHCGVKVVEWVYFSFYFSQTFTQDVRQSAATYFMWAAMVVESRFGRFRKYLGRC
jgi:hypothetical protein